MHGHSNQTRLIGMASSPYNFLSHITDSLSPSPSLPQTPSNTKSIQQVWKEVNLASLTNCSFDLNKDSSSILASDSSFVMQTAPTLLCLSSNSAFEKQICSSDASESNSKKRAQQDIYDQRHKRMIKNRESAVRSRARKQETLFLSALPQELKTEYFVFFFVFFFPLTPRKQFVQAYNKGLEIKISRLTEENFKLQKQLEELQFCLSSSAKSPRKSVSV